MEPTNSSASWLDSWHPDARPEVDDVRPACCAACGQPARGDGRIRLQGHGCRIRQVVVMPAFLVSAARLGECGERRYRCIACRAIAVVLPRGVLPRYLYSVAAIVVAFCLVAPPPVGAGLSDGAAYVRQGMYARRCSDAEADPEYRWRSLGRWAALAEQWWPGWPGRSVSALLVLFLERSGGQGLAAAVRVAVDGHARWGCPM